MGEELWKKFLPKYLESLGASVVIIGLFGTAEDFLDALYQYPGGWLADHWRRRRAFLALITTAFVGYLIYLLSPSWPLLFLGLALVMAWQSMASPAVFATIGDALPRNRALGFAFQSILKRLPMVFSPLLGGVLIGYLGIRAGIHIGLLLTLISAAMALLLLRRIRLPLLSTHPATLGDLWRSFHPVLKRLLISDIAIRTSEGMADIFAVLYVTNITGVSLPRYGILVAIQLATSLLAYFPSAKAADRIGRKPFVIATFLFFALFPVAVAVAHSFAVAAFAFLIGGLREIGEPSRKAMIVDFAPAPTRARTVGIYYLVRSLSITPASLVGGLLWRLSPTAPFFAAGAIGIVGTSIFTATIPRAEAGRCSRAQECSCPLVTEGYNAGPKLTTSRDRPGLLSVAQYRLTCANRPSLGRSCHGALWPL